MWGNFRKANGFPKGWKFRLFIYQKVTRKKWSEAMSVKDEFNVFYERLKEVPLFGKTRKLLKYCGNRRTGFFVGPTNVLSISHSKDFLSQIFFCPFKMCQDSRKGLASLSLPLIWYWKQIHQIFLSVRVSRSTDVPTPCANAIKNAETFNRHKRSKLKNLAKKSQVR